ncbi:hypothetical protein MJO28_016850 [Puccinia striiformis f. sp. tritici]|uniref:Uncharacterized protein n=2 Tax=Puccinia striiformis TaxID=27350 RepID=A0A0L0W2Y5_9BASI|nr:hypothetical protein Pst134EA_002697 [Puccinia striiformis f. sp. tritici]KAI9618334.1 hypothetical protein KEM48_006787 [Puccinia striiformis f. sp. tritici PST-130]KNF05871.1 hypothetical protein PSTG_00865 [Puccinia striiformis f. sp. tritici PST-78]POW13676.1 hypothetical protein PSTT_03526 [Puccinia striiformis]KAH9472071.1 hypothetical protein Pst134EA_002697 [Puccinia striiformis f. sp. tritici]KAI7935212.1 hypothetical protein MJO28_016850 [Puccinia striiformis f. sp. tritici]
MSLLKRLSHPMHTRTGADVLEELERNFSQGSAYGQMFYNSSIGFTDLETGQEKNILTKLCGYGPSSSGLVTNHVYMITGRMIAPNTKLTPVLHYDLDTVIPAGNSDAFTAPLADKTSVIGFGIVISRNEISEMSNNSVLVKNLYVVLQHTDYDPLTKQQVQFKAQYVISGRRNLANTFGLFQQGREVMISGVIAGYLQDQFMWKINAISVSVASGHQSTTNSILSSDKGLIQNRRKPGLVSVEGSTQQPGLDTITETGLIPGDAAKSQPASDPASAFQPNLSQGTPPSNFYTDVPSTSVKKRTKRQILTEAKKNIKLSKAEASAATVQVPASDSALV